MKQQTYRAQCQEILVVEDNLVNQKIISAMLVKLGHHPHVVANGQLAVEAVRDKCFGLVLMDCQMPVMDGYQATEVIRDTEQPRGRHVPIIALSANTIGEHLSRCQEAGMDDIVSKPINLELLREKVEFWLGNSGRLNEGAE